MAPNAPPIKAPLPVLSGEPSGLTQPVQTTAEVAKIKLTAGNFIVQPFAQIPVTR
jgi:hypothetical protein